MGNRIMKIEQTICDHCGTDLTHKVYEEKETADIKIWHYTPSCDKSHSYNRGLDLCPKCAEELTQMLQNWIRKI